MYADSAFSDHPLVLQYQGQVKLSENRRVLEQRRLLPDFRLDYSRQFVLKGFNPAGVEREYTPGTRIAAIQLGISIPLLGGAQRARVKAAGLEQRQAQYTLLDAENKLRAEYREQLYEAQKQYEGLLFYQSTALNEASEMLRIAQFAFSKGEIGYVEHLQVLSQALNIRMQHLEALRLYNLSVVQLNYLKGRL